MRKLVAGLLLLAFASVSPALAQPAFNNVGTQLTSFFNGTQAITKAFSGVSGKSIYLTQLTISGAATAVVTISTGTAGGTNCGTATKVIYTATLIAGENISIGDGAGAVAVVGPLLDVCVTVATASANGWLSIAQF